MSQVFVLDTNKQPLHPVHPGRARLLLKAGKAAVWRRYPFTIILRHAVPVPQVDPLRLKLDPGSKATGMTVINDTTGEVVFAAELSHRGHKISEALESRRATRRSRRQRKTRYRKPRFNNRRNKGEGWLPPSLASRISNVLTWVRRLSRLCPLVACSLELVKFDMQAMDYPDILGIQYQQGTLAGYEVREYLLEKWGHQCAYCGAKNVPLEIEHINPRSRFHDNRVCNLTLACHECNEKKGAQDIRVFLKNHPERLAQLLAQAKAPLRDASAVNSTRWTLYCRLQALGFPVECGSGGLTKFNRTMRGLPKAHWIDAACVGKSTPVRLKVHCVLPLLIVAQGHGSRQVTNVDRYGFPRGKPKQGRRVKGFRTGDMVKATVPTGARKGTYLGRVLVRSRGSFDIVTKTARVRDINCKYCRVVQRREGYRYALGTPIPLSK